MPATHLKTDKHSAEFVQVNTRVLRTNYTLFQAACADNDVTCAQALRRFIRDYCKQPAATVEVSH